MAFRMMSFASFGFCSRKIFSRSETTLLTMAIPLLHHGMLYVGLPYSEEELSTTTTGGSLYGATHVTWSRNPDELSADEKRLAFALGKRVAEIASKLSD